MSFIALSCLDSEGRVCSVMEFLFFSFFFFYFISLFISDISAHGRPDEEV